MVSGNSGARTFVVPKLCHFISVDLLASGVDAGELPSFVAEPNKEESRRKCGRVVHDKDILVGQLT